MSTPPQSEDQSVFDDVETDGTEIQTEDDGAVSGTRNEFAGYREKFAEQWATLSEDRSVVAAILVLLGFVLIAIFAPTIAPYGPRERIINDGSIADWEPPMLVDGSSEYVLGTTAQGFDIFSQLLYSSRAALFVGFSAAVFTVALGTSVGVVSGYYGGRTDEVLMRLVDFMYGLPLLPTVILLVALTGPSLTNVVLAIVILQWRTPARVIRSQALSLRERSFVQAAKVAGASDRHIIVKHLIPNVIPLSVLYGAFAIAWAILTEAGVSFLGFGDPENISWGTMLQSARSYNAVTQGAWWWIITPGLCIALLVISGFLIGRGYEEINNPELQE